ncbi:MAG: metallophosphoesterase family protein [Caulobacteraceae bacterium]
MIGARALQYPSARTVRRRRFALWGGPPGSPRRASPSRYERSTEGMLVYAIGDIHGRADLLANLLARIDEDSAGSDAPRRLVLLGDYVDRGPGSREVIELLVQLKSRGDEVVHLLGNHDATLLDFLMDPQVGPTWCAHGGLQTLMSYGVQPPAVGADYAAWVHARSMFLKALPQSHKEFFTSAQLQWQIGSYFFSHAGVRPQTTLAEQSRRDLLWIRKDFIDDTRPLEKIIVHGHTPAMAVHVDDRRIGVDTGAYATGVLAAVRLLDAEIRIIIAQQRDKTAAARQPNPSVNHTPQLSTVDARRGWTVDIAARRS